MLKMRKLLFFFKLYFNLLFEIKKVVNWFFFYMYIFVFFFIGVGNFIDLL